MKSWYHYFPVSGIALYWIFNVFLVLTELEDLLDRFQQRPSQPVRPVMEAKDTSGDESKVSPRKKKVLSKKTYRMKKDWASSELAWLFVTGPMDPVAKPSHFYCHICRRVVSVLTQRLFGFLRLYQSAKQFTMDQRLRLETTGCRGPNFSRNSMPDEEIERELARITRTPLAPRDRQYPFCEDLISDKTGVLDLQLLIPAQVSSSLEVLRLGGSYELVEQQWAQFSHTAICINIEVCWSRNEVLVSIRICSV